MSAARHFSRSGLQRGFALVSAIFLLVILAALGAFMLTMSTSQHITSTQDLQGSRAYWAAKGGVQWALDRIKSTSACPVSPTVLALDGFSVSVTCDSKPYTEGTDAKVIYWLGSTATGGGAVGSISYTERQVNAFVEF